jgi:hypothetical protein
MDASGVAQFDWSQLSPGTHSIAAQYVGATGFAPSTSSVVTQVVNVAPTTIGLVVSPSEAPLGTRVTLTATVSSSYKGAAVTGVVTFYDAATATPVGSASVSNGTVSIELTTLEFGNRVLTAHYGGNTVFVASTSAGVAHGVTASASATHVVVSPSPSFVSQSVTVFATVSSTYPGATPSGWVTFYDGSTFVDTAPLNAQGVAQITMSFATTRSNVVIVASYSGDGQFAGSSGLAQHAVAQAPTTLVVSASPSPAPLGSVVTVTATLTSSFGATPPTGTITFRDATVLVGSVPLGANGTVSINLASLAMGEHRFTASYSGNLVFLASTSAPFQCLVAQATSNVGFTISPWPTAKINEPITLTATVTSTYQGFVPTGTVYFRDGQTSLGTPTLDTSGVARLRLAGLNVGRHILTAAYSGDTSFASGTSAEIIYSVDQTPSAISLVVTPAATILGDAVSLTASVSCSTCTGQRPSGTVTFHEGATSLGTSPVAADGFATWSLSSLSPGSHTLSASYGGNDIFGPSWSETVTQTVARIPSVATLTASPLNPAAGATVMLSVTVSSTRGGAPATGTVSFYDDLSLLGTLDLDSLGAAFLLVPSFAVRAHWITASYGGDVRLTQGTSNPVSIAVAKAGTATTVDASPTSQIVGRPLTLTATVVDNYPAARPSGTVTFFDGASRLGSTALSTTSGVVSLVVPTLSVGVHRITARYEGDANFADSQSIELAYRVDGADTVTTLTAAARGQGVTLTSQVTSEYAGSTPSGSVTFMEGTSSVSEVALGPGVTATLAIPIIAPGEHTYSAVYGGDGTFVGSVSPPVTYRAGKVATSTTLAVSSTAVSGAPATVRATVLWEFSDAAPSGLIVFREGAVWVGAASCAAGIAEVNVAGFTPGDHVLTAEYQGDAIFVASTSTPFTHRVTRAPTTTTLDVVSSSAPFGAPITLTATVTSTGKTMPSGIVFLREGDLTIGTAVLNERGIAALTLRAAALGLHKFVATYGGDENFAASTSLEAPGNVQTASTTTTLAVGANPVLLTAVVSGAPAGATLSGTVTFFEARKSLATVLLGADGVAVFAPTFSSGLHLVSASYGGEARFGSSTSTVMTVGTSTLALVAGPAPSLFGERVTFTSSSPMTGMVTLLVDGAFLGAAPLIDGVATVSSTSLAAGALVVSATDEAANATSIVQVVRAAETTTGLVVGPDPATWGGEVTLTARVLGPGAFAYEGTVTFLDGTDVLGEVPIDVDGGATLVTRVLTRGAHVLSARYEGARNRAASTSPSVSLMVQSALTGTVLQSAPNPSSLGDRVTLTATVQVPSGMPQGVVTFLRDNGTGFESFAVVQVATDGTARWFLDGLVEGTVILQARYEGTDGFLQSVSPRVFHDVRRGLISDAGPDVGVDGGKDSSGADAVIDGTWGPDALAGPDAGATFDASADSGIRPVGADSGGCATAPRARSASPMWAAFALAIAVLWQRVWRRRGRDEFFL